MQKWRAQLKFDPLPMLMASGNKAVAYFTRRDLLGEAGDPVETLWCLPEAEKILRRQQSDGSWKYPGGREQVRRPEDYNQLETFRNLGWLVEKYGFDRRHAAIRQAADFLFSHQTEEGDIRGIMGTQYATHYTAGMLELLVKAGFADDPEVEKGMQWLLMIRQDDGGWAFPLRAANVSYAEAMKLAAPIQPLRSKPFSHLLTGVVLRAFAAHPRYRNSLEAVEAGKLLLSRFFKSDKYIDRGDKSYWQKVSFPFWFTDILSALDSLSLIGFTTAEAEIETALGWLGELQREDGSFQLEILKTGSDGHLPAWVCLAVCRVFRRFYPCLNSI
jgi:hypothetical protein